MRRTSPIMTTFSLTRRQLARMALTGAAATLVPATVEAQNSENPTTTISLSPSEGAMLANAVPFNVGYALTEVQTREVAAALKDYPAAFSKARAYALPDDIGPAWVGTVPPPRSGKGRS